MNDNLRSPLGSQTNSLRHFGFHLGLFEACVSIHFSHNNYITKTRLGGTYYGTEIYPTILYTQMYSSSCWNTPVHLTYFDFIQFVHIVTQAQSEFHILLECRKFHEFRQQIISSYHLTSSNTFKMSKLLNSDNPKKLARLAAFEATCIF